MSLDLSQLASQISRMVSLIKVEGEERRSRLDFALKTLRAQAKEFDFLKKKIQARKSTWLVADLVENLDTCYATVPCPENYMVMAVDGSHIDVDRHRSVRCYLINIGAVRLDYGNNPDAWLSSSPLLFFEDKDLILSSKSGPLLEIPIAGPLLAIKRTSEECRYLAEMVKGLEGDKPALALLDGSLILWGLAGQAYPDFVAERLLVENFLKSLDAMREEGQGKRLALASYISFSRSPEVVNILRIALCPYELVDCDRHCSAKRSGERECDRVAGINDGDLFSQFLGSGERSAIFASLSSVVEKYYGAHQVYFFYLNIGDEIARVEIPQWVARDKSLVELVQSLVLEQCRLGQGYPVALSEAHEKAVISASDREEFWWFVEHSLAAESLPASISAKSRSKRTRWV